MGRWQRQQTARGRPPPDPVALLRSRNYVRLLVLAAILGVPISAVAYGFLALVSYLQKEIFIHLPHGLGFSTEPVWWPLPVLAVGGVLAGFAIRYLPGRGGPSAAGAFAVHAPPTAVQLPGVILAALATLVFGAVLGPEMPLIALGGGLAALVIRLARRREVPDQAARVLGVTGSFAAVATLLGSPLTGAFLLMEASGLGGPILGVVLLPGLLAAGIGSLIFIGLDNLTGLGTFSLALPGIPGFSQPTGAQFGWAIVIGLAAAVIGPALHRLALLLEPLRPVAHARGPAGRGGGRRAGDHLRRGDRQGHLRRALLRRERARPADHPRRQLLGGRAGAADGVQGARLRSVAEQLPGRARSSRPCSSARPGAWPCPTCPGCRPSPVPRWASAR